MLQRSPIQPIFEPQVCRDPFFSLRRSSRSILSRVIADLLVRLLIVSTLPSNYQAAAALFTVSVLWPLVATEEKSEATSIACIFETRVRGFEEEKALLVGLESSQAAELRRGYDLGYGGIASDRPLNAKVRFYDPLYGRFISQDSCLGNIDDPPSLHRYFYANDNPAFFVDPKGHLSLAQIAERERVRQAAIEQAAPKYVAGAYAGQVPEIDPNRPELETREQLLARWEAQAQLATRASRKPGSA